jgi:hypothetical protein
MSTSRCVSCLMTGTIVQTEVAPEIRVHGQGVTYSSTVLTVYQVGSWGKWVKRSEVAAFVCTNCGYVQLFARNPKALK